MPSTGCNPIQTDREPAPCSSPFPGSAFTLREDSFQSPAIPVDATAEGESAPLRVTIEREGAEILRFPAFGPTSHRLPPGDATVTVSRGLEYDVHVEDITFR